MTNIFCKRSAFGPSWGADFNGWHRISASWAKLVWAAITVGKPGLPFLTNHGWHSVSDVIVRSHMVYANLRERAGGYEKSSYYEALDPTEKGFVSYFLGMMAAKIVAADVLDVPWLFHLSMLQSLGGRATLIGKSAPDLIGLNRRMKWAVVEAKGRTNRHNQEAARSAKLQTRQLRKINGDFPFVRVAVQAFFSPALEFSVDDPDDYDDDASDFDGDVNLALERYYAYTVRAIQTSAKDVPIGGEEFRFGVLDEIGVSVGLPVKVLRMLENRQYDAVLRHLSERRFDEGLGVSADGIAISLDSRWTTEQMRLDLPSRDRSGST
ncbi:MULTISPECIES: hypothetical protein [pseudomallei group]|uniref:hypothetical protein n=1 Tax=pseudomallei group TaxID=111527 RepID=UPI0011C39D11|nr:hypothetical protein [Burkholderia pseudomallei]